MPRDVSILKINEIKQKIVGFMGFTIHLVDGAFPFGHIVVNKRFIDIAFKA
jgi:hypothetical protein